MFVRKKKHQETITACSLKMQQESAVKETKKFYENTNDNLNYVHLIEKNSPKINYHFCQINITPLL